MFYNLQYKVVVLKTIHFSSYIFLECWMIIEKWHSSTNLCIIYENDKKYDCWESGEEIWKNMMASGQFESKHYHDEYSTKQTKKFRNFTSNVLKTHKISRKNFYKLTNVLPPSFVKLRFKSMIGKYIWIKQKRVSKGEICTVTQI